MRRDFEDVNADTAKPKMPPDPTQTGLEGAQTARASAGHRDVRARRRCPALDEPRDWCRPAFAKQWTVFPAFAVGLGGLEQLPTPSRNFADLAGALPLPVRRHSACRGI